MTRRDAAPSLRTTLAALGFACALVIGFALLSGAGEGGAPAKPAGNTPPAATVSRSVKEADLNIVTLSPEAEERLISTAILKSEDVSRARLYPGEITVPPGRAVIVSAPFAGIIRAADAPASAGVRVAEGKAVLMLAPLLTNDARATMAGALVDAEGLVSTAEVMTKAATVALARAQELVSQQAGSTKALDEAKAQSEVAQKTLAAATARRDLLKRTLGVGEGNDRGVGTVGPPLSIDAPATGVLKNVSVAPGQIVSAGAPLFEVISLDGMWVRVPVYAGDIAAVAAERPATVTRLGAPPATRPAARPATSPAGSAAPATSPANDADAPVVVSPAIAPPSADPRLGTVDLFYDLGKPSQKFVPGQRVAIRVTLAGQERALVVPWSAVTFDIHDGTWVYERVGPRAYARRRVRISHVDGGKAVLTEGPAEGITIVTRGVAELFGREMGYAQ